MTKILLMACCLALVSCASYKYADNVKLISFSDDVSKGQSAGLIEGESCQWMVLGNFIGDQVSVDRAFMNSQKENKVRYINNVSTDTTGWNVGTLIGKNCLVVKGAGYR